MVHQAGHGCGVEHPADDGRSRDFCKDRRWAAGLPTNVAALSPANLQDRIQRDRRVYAMNLKYRDGTRLRSLPELSSAFNGVWVPNDEGVDIVGLSLPQAASGEVQFARVRKSHNGEEGWILLRNLWLQRRLVGYKAAALAGSSGASPQASPPTPSSSPAVAVLGHLGAGAGGSVARALLVDGRPAAVKVVSKGDSAENAAALRREFDMLRGLNHPNIVRVLGFEATASDYQLHLELMEGESLAARCRQVGGRLHERELRHVLRQALRGLAYLHERSVLHRDVKPANMLRDAHGNVKLADFGLSLVESTTRRTLTTAGTPIFMAHEVLEGHACAASDIWALAGSIVDLAGAQPYREAGLTHPVQLALYIGSLCPPHHMPHIPTTLSPALRSILESCFAYDPSDRPSAKTLLERPYFSDMAIAGEEALDDYCAAMEPLRSPVPRNQTNSETPTASAAMDGQNEFTVFYNGCSADTTTSF